MTPEMNGNEMVYGCWTSIVFFFSVLEILVKAYKLTIKMLRYNSVESNPAVTYAATEHQGCLGTIFILRKGKRVGGWYS